MKICKFNFGLQYQQSDRCDKLKAKTWISVFSSNSLPDPARILYQPESTMFISVSLSTLKLSLVALILPEIVEALSCSFSWNIGTCTDHVKWSRASRKNDYYYKILWPPNDQGTWHLCTCTRSVCFVHKCLCWHLNTFALQPFLQSRVHVVSFFLSFSEMWICNSVDV